MSPQVTFATYRERLCNAKSSALIRPPNSLPENPHRSDIEGLRGVAVLAVTAVHAWPELLRGGFVGVDIFFVLSGYLISTLIFRALQKGQFDLRDFYIRRVRRLFPALCTVLLACLLFSAFFTFPSQARQVGQHVAAGAVFASNLALWLEAGYFDAASESKPLLHLWSLGIEEQFYILWPLAAVLVFRWRQHGLKITGGLLLLSFALNVVWVVAKAKGTFFLLPTRAWELLIGAALAQIMVFGLPAGRWLRLAQCLQPHRNAAAWLGVALIGAALALLDKGKHFPGWWALLPTGGTALLLAAGPQAWFNRHVLSHKVLVFYGAISYPLYLWHWPLLVFPLLLGWELDAAMRVLVLSASVALAALTLEYIERPLRANAWGPRTATALCGVMLCIGAAGLALRASDGLMARYPKDVQSIAKTEFGFDYGQYRSSRCFLDLEQGPAQFASECAGLQGGTLLWGDSHAASLFPGLAAVMPAALVAASGLQGMQSLSQYTKARCPPLMQPPSGSSRGCAQSNAFALRQVAATAPHTVVLGGHWSFYGGGGAEALPLAELRRSVQALQALGVPRIIVMGHLPTWTAPLPRVLLTAWRQSGVVSERSLLALDARAVDADRAVQHALEGTGALFISPIDTLCNAAGCLVTQLRNGVAHPMAHDESHLTAEGSAVLVRRSRARLFNEG